SEVNVEGSITSVLGDERWLLVGTDQGAITAFDSAGKSTPFHGAADKKPVRWLTASKDLVLYGDESMVYALETNGTDIWKSPVEGGPPALADEKNVYEGGPAGLSAFVR